MAQFFFNFENDTIGQLPAGMASYLGSWTNNVQSDSGDKGVRFAAGVAGSAFQSLVFSDIGVVDNATAKEIVAHVKLVAGESAAAAGVPLVSLFQSSVNANGYTAWYEGNFSRVRIVVPNTAGDSIATTVATVASYPLTVDTYYRVRLRFVPGGTLRIRITAGTTDQAELDNINALLTAALQPTVGSIDAAKDLQFAWNSQGSNTTYTSGRFAIGARASNGETFYSMVGIATAGETAPTSSASVPTITDAGDENYLPGETGISITGTGFGAQGPSSRVWISPTDNVSDSNRVQQTVTGWSDTSVVFQCVAGSLPRATNLYLFVVNDGGLANGAGHVVQIPVTGPTINDAGDESYTVGESVVITGTAFGTQGPNSRVWISPTNNVNDPNRVQQTVTAWGATSITFTAVKGSLPFLATAYLFVVNDAGESNNNGYAVQIVPRVYVQDSVVDLEGNPVALNGETLLVWRQRPTAAASAVSQAITLGSIPSGVLNVEIARGALAVGDPVWVALISAAGNQASMKRIVPVYQ